jgi:hypothetical protein
MSPSIPLSPAKAGIQIHPLSLQAILKVPRSRGWVPAFAGMSGV